jgi:hypothetical protein
MTDACVRSAGGASSQQLAYSPPLGMAIGGAAVAEVGRELGTAEAGRELASTADSGRLLGVGVAGTCHDGTEGTARVRAGRGQSCT